MQKDIFVIAFQEMSEGFVKVVDIEGRHFHLTGERVPAYEQRFDFADAFCEGLARVCSGEVWFHICKDGAPAYPQRYLFVGNFKNGFAEAKDRQGWLHIDKKGRPAYSTRYDWVGPFDHGFAITHLRIALIQD